MATDHPLAPTPLTFELPRSLVERIHSCRTRLGLKSASAVVRRALECFDFSAFTAPRREQCQVSVRLSPAQKRLLFHHARRQRVSAGVLLRTALEALARGCRGGHHRRRAADSLPGKTSRRAASKVTGVKRLGRKRR
ncbi:MAG TPA: CopG family transcriptional regulator [Opitutaceae bacterium]|nr:CopG family transcriptional regulator [Opitutaceae bacterium]